MYYLLIFKKESVPLNKIMKKHYISKYVKRFQMEKWTNIC
jgi:hypothetical protein